MQICLVFLFSTPLKFAYSEKLNGKITNFLQKLTIFRSKNYMAGGVQFFRLQKMQKCQYLQSFKAVYTGVVNDLNSKLLDK